MLPSLTALEIVRIPAIEAYTRSDAKRERRERRRGLVENDDEFTTLLETLTTPLFDVELLQRAANLCSTSRLQRMRCWELRWLPLAAAMGWGGEDLSVANDVIQRARLHSLLWKAIGVHGPLRLEVRNVPLLNGPTNAPVADEEDLLFSDWKPAYRSGYALRLTPPGGAVPYINEPLLALILWVLGMTPVEDDTLAENGFGATVRAGWPRFKGYMLGMWDVDVPLDARRRPRHDVLYHRIPPPTLLGVPRVLVVEGQPPGNPTFTQWTYTFSHDSLSPIQSRSRTV